MGNSNSASGGSASSGGAGGAAAGGGAAAAGGSTAQQRSRRPSISEEQPLVVSSIHGAQTLVDDQYQFSQSLIKSAGLHAPGNGSPAEDVIYARYRAGSVSEPPRFQVKDNQLPTVIKWDKGGKEVFVSGSFNGWKKIQLVKSTNNFYTIVNLNEGEHEYKFLVDGQWVHNPDEPFRSNALGTVNNVVTVKKSDFEIFQALDKDIAAVQAKSAEIVSGSPPGNYTQDIPVRKPLDRHTGPPILPPQLLQVILNKDIPEHLEPSLLPEPNHVMLNHLYALSIKDGVMVLSSTSRYKKKSPYRWSHIGTISCNPLHITLVYDPNRFSAHDCGRCWTDSTEKYYCICKGDFNGYRVQANLRPKDLGRARARDFVALARLMLTRTALVQTIPLP